MRMTQIFSTTLRDAPTDAEAASHQLLLRAGFIRPLAAGVFSYLPLARRALNRIEAIIREEMDAIGGQEVTMPVVHPASLWQETGRWYEIDAEMGRFKDRSGRDMVLGMTHEEVAADLARREIHSYRQLPVMLYQIQTKWRDDPRPRAGLVRAREFTMKDAYTFAADWEGLDQQYRSQYQAYFNIFRRCGLPVIAVTGDVGMMGGRKSHEYMYLTPMGEDTLILCDECGYAANRQVACMRTPPPETEAALPLEAVATPECKTIADLAEFLHIPASKTAKAVFFVASRGTPERVSGATLPEAVAPAGEAGGAQPVSAQSVAATAAHEQFIFAVVRGDMELNETKLANVLHAQALRPATEEEIRAVGAVPGYASPVGLADVLVVVDERVTQSPNLVSGANRAGVHLWNVNYGRDYTATLVADLVAARAGDACAECGAPLREARGVEVGHIFQLGTRYTNALKAAYLNSAGEEAPLWMGSYGIGITRLLACIAEEHHDAQGLIWPVTIAPYAVHLVVLSGRAGGAGSASLAAAESLYATLQAAGLETLYDDRTESPGVKFNDADLIGLPLRITVAERALQLGCVEMKRRDQTEKELVPVENVVVWVQRVLAEMAVDNPA